MSHKIVVIGDVNGQLTSIFGRLKTLHAKQNFAFAIVAGNLFANTDHASQDANEEQAQLLEGKIDVPLPTYFTVGKRSLPQAIIDRLESNGGEVVPNLVCLARRSRIKTSEGIEILSIGGERSELPFETQPSSYDSKYHDKDVFNSIGFNHADIMVTSDWPENISNGSKVLCAGPATEEVQSLSKLCSEIKPRYHFSTSPAFYEREPFYHDADEKTRMTRFIALAAFGNPNKEKYIYAFTYHTDAAQTDALPPALTVSPFSAVRKRKLESQQDAFRFASGSNGDTRPSHRGKRRKQAGPPQPQQCYFCLSNPACETHMIGSIGDNAYLATAKGPLTTRDTFAGLGFPGHLIIIPLVHAPTLASIPDEDVRTGTGEEMQRYQRALHKMITASKEADLGSVCWEISRSSGVHDHWQFLPMPLQLLKQGVIESAFKKDADELDYPAFRDESPDVEEIEKSDYFKVTMRWHDEKKAMVMPLDHSFYFDLQFGRRVLGKLLGLAERANWKDCGQNHMDEQADALRFKELFKEYDFSLEES